MLLWIIFFFFSVIYPFSFPAATPAYYIFNRLVQHVTAGIPCRIFVHFYFFSTQPGYNEKSINHLCYGPGNAAAGWLFGVVAMLAGSWLLFEKKVNLIKNKITFIMNLFKMALKITFGVKIYLEKGLRILR